MRAQYSASYLSKVLHGHRRLLPSVARALDDALEANGELEHLAREQEVSRREPLRPMQLPAVAGGFVGREDYLHELDAALIAQTRPGAAMVTLVEGGFWVGKTALALQWASRVHHRFPGGCLFADLRGLAPGHAADPSVVLDAFLQALGLGPQAQRGTIDERAARYRSVLAEQPALVVLDNVASYEQVRPLLPGAGSAVVLTSREHQPALLLRTGGLRIDLPPLSTEDALTLLRQRVGEARVAAEPDAAQAVVRHCGRLPMAVLIAGEHIQQRHHGSLRSLAEALATESRRLDLFTSADPTMNIRAVIDLSYLALPPRERRVFRLAGISPAPAISPESAAALTGLDVDTAQASLTVLRHAHLLEDAPGERLRMSDLLHAYARYRGIVDEPTVEVERAHGRVLALVYRHRMERREHDGSRLVRPSLDHRGHRRHHAADLPR
ncbi:NB-ARC domain-containing protein [Amycolatopsis taiwanensis]|uniref:NB-ARC domain-containing protein n=1 Tax=Amycolatopsis taiwanensis TaxID=342230 RepID=A0A9W6R416_9PSEU|nr:NB-ARC domain-containing protein [Amycolatopsis taiwanensis]GLY68729.1 hypothetical protein Atai01_53480 [Amycolatopsis taiwanensis]